MCTQFANILIDEIALEGLDGINLQTLWIRLKVRLNVECIPDQLRNYVWQFICNSNDVVCHELPTNRKDFVPVDRALSVSSGLKGDYNYPEDIYGLSPINHLDERGSCPCYATRSRIPISTIENKNCNEIEEKYGTKLVVVASQSLRNKVLSQGHPTSLISALNLECYCFLERIGRSRFMGEATVGPHAFKNFKLKHAYGYLIKLLIEYELVTQQTYCYGRLFQLKRFQQLFLPKSYKALHSVISELIKRPSKSLTTQEVNDILHNEHKHTKRKKLNFPKAVVLEADSSLNQEDQNSERKNKCPIKTYRLTDSNFDFTTWYLNRNFNETDKKEANNNGEDPGTKINPIFTSSRFSQIIKIFYERGQEGVTIADISRRVNIDYKKCLRVMQNYVKLNIFNTTKEEFGKVRRYKYILPYFNNEEEKIEKEFDNNLETNLDLEQEPEVGTEPEINPVLSSAKDPDGLTDVFLNANESQTVIDEGSKIEYEIIQRKFPTIYSNNVHRKKLLKRHCITITHEFKVNTILKYLAEHAVITSLQSVVLYFIDCGYKYKIDRKTIRKFLVKLAELDYVNIFDLRFIHKPTNTNRDFVIYSNTKTKLNSCRVSVEIEKMKFIFMNQMKFHVGNDQNKSPAIRSRIKEVQFLSDSEFLKLLGFKPKNERSRLFHSFLFYLVYEEQKDSLFFNQNEYEMWKNVVPTFVRGVNNIPGTILLSTIIQNMPVSLIIQIIRINKYVPEFEDYVRNPSKRLYLYKDLTPQIQLMFHNLSGFFYRQYIRSYVRFLVSYGLAQVAAYYNNDIVIYLNRNLTLKDTRNRRNEILTYRLNSIYDLQDYWYHLKEISLSLDNPKSLRLRQDRVKEQYFVKQCFKYVTSLEDFPLRDNGHIPGDGKGVAGFNSSVNFYHSQGWSFEHRLKVKKKYTKKKPKKAIVMNNGANPVKVVIRKKSSNNSRKQFRLRILDQRVKRITNLPKANVTFEQKNVLIMCQLAANFFYKNPSRILIRAFLKQIAQSVVPSFKKMSLKVFHVKINSIIRTSLVIRKMEQALKNLKSDNEICNSFYREDILKNFKTNPQKVYDLYKEFFNFIYNKFETIDSILMQKDKPFDIAELDNYVIIYHEDDDNEIVNKPLTFNDIKSQTFQSIILSVMFSQQDKTNIDFQLKEILVTFDFDLRSAVCDYLKRLKIISYDKPYIDSYYFPYKSASKLWSFFTFKYTPEYYYKSYLIQEDVLDSLKCKNCVQIKYSNDYYVWFFKKWPQIDSEFDVDVIVPKSMFRNVSDKRASRWNCECNIQETYNFILNDFKTNAIMDSTERLFNEIESVKNICSVRWESVKKLSMSRHEDDNSCDSLSIISSKLKVEVEILSEIVNLIKSNTYNGLSAILLKEKIGSLFDQKNIKLLDVLDALESDAKLILQTGLNQIVYVHRDYWKPWIVTSTKLTRLEKEKIIGSNNVVPSLQGLQIDVPVSPWIRIDGSLNRRLFDHLICMLLNFCIENPTVKFIQVVNYYYFLSPVQIFVLLKFLRDLNCIKIQKLVQVKGQVTLLSTISDDNEYLTEADDFDDFNGLLIETNPDCCLIMTNYISNKKYSAFLNR